MGPWPPIERGPIIVGGAFGRGGLLSREDISCLEPAMARTWRDRGRVDCWCSGLSCTAILRTSPLQHLAACVLSPWKQQLSLHWASTKRWSVSEGGDHVLSNNILCMARLGFVLTTLVIQVPIYSTCLEVSVMMAIPYCHLPAPTCALNSWPPDVAPSHTTERPAPLMAFSWMDTVTCTNTHQCVPTSSQDQAVRPHKCSSQTQLHHDNALW